MSQLINNHLTISLDKVEILKDYESFSSTWYLCPAKKWTIGWGHVRTKKDNFDKIDIQKGEELLREDCAFAENCVKKYVDVALNQNQFDALVLFIFNIGVAAFATSTILKLINAENFMLAAAQFERWINFNGKPSRGLKIRRKKESLLFSKPVESSESEDY